MYHNIHPIFKKGSNQFVSHFKAFQNSKACNLIRCHSFVVTKTYITCCFLDSGTGTLGVPFAVMQGGYMSLVAIVVISVITNYTGKLIIKCLYEKPFHDQQERGVRLRNSYASIGKLSKQCVKRTNYGRAHDAVF